MNFNFKNDSNKYLFIRCENIEESAKEQIQNLINHPLIEKIAIMPDCHAGKGVPIGSVIACNNAVIPNAVGSDIGCGMSYLQTNIDKSELENKEFRRKILDKIKEEIPVGEGKDFSKYSLFSSSHGAGRSMSRTKASNELSLEECDNAMEGIVFDRFSKKKRYGKGKAKYDFGEAPQAYKNIDLVIEQQQDIIDVLDKVYPIISVKG